MVSSSEEKKREEFVVRFIEVCGTHHPTKISDQLDISYQAAKNYLNGRMPDASVLLKIADKTNFSIHWLLTGVGEKFVTSSYESELNLLLENIQGGDPSDFVSEFGLFLKTYFKNKHTSTDSPKTVILTPDKIRKEKVKEKDSSKKDLKSKKEKN